MFYTFTLDKQFHTHTKTFFMVLKIIFDVIALLLALYFIEFIYSKLYKNLCEAYKRCQINSIDFFIKKKRIETFCIILFFFLIIIFTFLIYFF